MSIKTYLSEHKEFIQSLSEESGISLKTIKRYVSLITGILTDDYGLDPAEIDFDLMDDCLSNIVDERRLILADKEYETLCHAQANSLATTVNKYISDVFGFKFEQSNYAEEPILVVKKLDVVGRRTVSVEDTDVNKVDILDEDSSEILVYKI